jgi:uncharacterized membrane protein YuzA (DUF378 family)
MKGELIDKLAALITAAFGLVAALAWNETIKTIFKSIFGTQETIWSWVVYAVVVTVIAVLVTLRIAKMAAKAKSPKE